MDLHWWAESGQVEPLREAIASGADLEARDDEGRTALLVAVLSGMREAIAVLLEAGADPDAAEEATPGYRPLQRAALAADLAPRERIAILELLLRRGADAAAADSTGTTALHLVIPWGTSEVVDELLAAGANAGAADRGGRTPFHVAASRGATAVADLLLGDDGEISSPTPSTREDTALARLDDRAILESLLNAGANPDPADASGDTPLHVAAERGADATVAWLLAHGADPSRRDDDDVTPLHRAANGDIAAKLIEAGAPIDPPDRDGRTPLHRAVGDGRSDVVDRLLAHDALAGIGDREGRTPLHVAAAAGRAHLVERLLDAGADVNAKDGDGFTPLYWADAGRHSLVMATLRRRGGRRGRARFFG